MPVPVPLPWRSVWLPRVAVIVALVIGLPLFLRSPPWCDLTLYELAARNLLSGGVHYRDLFDTNLPGFVWLLTGLRWLFGPSPIVIRLADLLVVTGCVILIDCLAKWGGASKSSRWWALAGVAFLYPYVGEEVHVQRDIWMALPVLSAVAIRLKRIEKMVKDSSLTNGSASNSFGKTFQDSFLEGVIWGMAVWLKPHALFMATGIWFLTIFRLSAGRSRPIKNALIDLCGNLCGGVIVGLCGLAWLIESGTWPDFWYTLTVWNPFYAKLITVEFIRDFSFTQPPELFWYPPFSLWLIPTVPLAIFSIIDARLCTRRRPADPKSPGPVGRLLPSWLWDTEAGWDKRFTRGVLAGLYLIWAIQAAFIQRRLIYVHMPETLLMLGLWASHRWAMAIIPLLWMAVTSCLWLYADANPGFRGELLSIAKDKWASAYNGQEPIFIRHPLANRERMDCWSECWWCKTTPREKYAFWDRLRQIRDFEASICWEELDDVAEFLRKKNVKDGEVIAWHDSTHAVYLMLEIKPGIRFMHTTTARLIGEEPLLKELEAAAGTARFAIGDLEAIADDQLPEDRPRILGPPQAPNNLLPANLKPKEKSFFPITQPIIFRSRGGLGRYTVHQLAPGFEKNPGLP